MVKAVNSNLNNDVVKGGSNTPANSIQVDLKSKGGAQTCAQGMYFYKIISYNKN